MQDPQSNAYMVNSRKRHHNPVETSILISSSSQIQQDSNKRPKTVWSLPYYRKSYCFVFHIQILFEFRWKNQRQGEKPLSAKSIISWSNSKVSKLTFADGMTSPGLSIPFQSGLVKWPRITGKWWEHFSSYSWGLSSVKLIHHLPKIVQGVFICRLLS